MGYKIGLDFGTTNSTLAYIENGNNPETFKYPGPSGTDYIPSCVAVSKNKKNDVVRIGRDALRVAGYENVEFYKNMKMLLPRPASEWSRLGWGGNKSPETIITEYLRKILISNKRGSYSFSREIGDIEGIVVSVPQAWLTRQPNHLGRPRLEKIIRDNLKLPLIQLISEPVAAAAYYTYWYLNRHRKPFKGNLLVCDMGGGTFDVTLCRLDENKVEVLANDGNGISELGKAGVYFDTKLLQLAYSRVEKEKALDPASSVFYELYKKLQEYKVDCAQHISDNIEVSMLHPSYSRKLPVIESPLVCYMDEIEAAFSEVKSGIETVLERFLNLENLKKEPDNHEKLHIDEVIFVGGFNEFELTRHTIKKFLQDNREYIKGKLHFVDDINSRMAANSIAFGAALIANDRVIVEEIYPHTIGIVLEWKIINTEKENNEIKLVNKKNYIPLIEGKNKISNYKRPFFHKDFLLAFDKHPRLTIYIKPGSGENIAEKEIPNNMGITLPNFKIDNRWQVGMKLDDSQLAYIVFKDELNNEESTHYELGNILTEMFGLDGLILSED